MGENMDTIVAATRNRHKIEEIEKILKEDNLDLTVRAEALTLEQFIKIANNYNK